MTAKEIIKRMKEISEETGISLDDLYLTASIPHQISWNEWASMGHYNDKFIVNAEPFGCVDTHIVYHPDIPFILQLQPNQGSTWLMAEDCSKSGIPAGIPTLPEDEIQKIEVAQEKYREALER